MSQRNLQIIVIAISVTLFSVLYFGVRTKPLKTAKVDKTRALRAEGSTDTEKMIESAKAGLTKEQLAPILAIEKDIPLQLTDSLRTESLKSISKEWNLLNKFAIGGIYAKQIAEIQNTEESWSIAGTTFGIGQQRETDSEIRAFCTEEAIAAFNKAIEINPGYVNAQLNLSTTYVNEGNGLIDAMNALGNSSADVAKYDQLKKQKDDLFREGANIIEEALKMNTDNKGLLSQLKNIYGALGDNDNFMRLKKLLGE